MKKDFKYYAFISYNSRDLEWGKRLQKKLEKYRMPATLCSEKGWERTPINPVFFAPTDIQPGALTEELKERLQASRNLIVICSPNSAKSQWVGEEIAYFHSLGRAGSIHFFIVDGEPHSGNPDSECFNPILEKLGMPEILGANINEKIYRLPYLNRERAYVQLISKLLGVEFDSIWQRHKRTLGLKISEWIIGTTAIVCALIYVWQINQYTQVTFKLTEQSVHNEDLPPLKDAIVALRFNDEIKSDTIPMIDSSIIFRHIIKRFIGDSVNIRVSCRNFIDIDTTILLNKEMEMGIRRDESVYGDIHFKLWNPEQECPVAGAKIYVGGKEMVSDEEGNVTAFIPLANQKSSYPIISDLSLAKDTLSVPCGPHDIIPIAY